MTLNAAVIMPPLQQVIFDKTLLTFLTNGTVFFWEDSNRTIPKNVYTLTGTGPGSYIYVSLGAQLTLSGLGSYIDANGGNIAVYLWPFTGTPNDVPPSQTVDNYYITVYSSTGVFQFDMPNWPAVTGNQSPINTAETTDNIISNPQFVDVNFQTTATVSVPATYNTAGTLIETEIAPDWTIVTTGTGTFNVYQQPIIDNTAPSNPPYALGISSLGYSQPLILRQRIYSPRLFSGNYVSGTFLAKSVSGGVIPLTMNYTPSITGTIQQICTGSTATSGFTTIANTTAIQITNPGGGTGYIDITIVIPIGVSIQITSIQLCGVASQFEQVLFLEQSPEREVDHLFHYFQPQINFKPSPSILVGWDFPLNPAQFAPVVSDNFNAPKYIWDQTIAASHVGNVACLATPLNDGIQFVNANIGESFYIMQYLDGRVVQNMLGNPLSVNIFGFANTTNVTARVYLFRAGVGAVFPLLPASIGSISTNGIFTLTQPGWTQIKPLTYTDTSGILPFVAVNSDINNAADLQFPGFEITDSTELGDTSKFAMVVTFNTPTVNTLVRITSISLTQGMIATRPAPQTTDQVLRECRRYFEMSYGTPGLIGNVTIARGPFIFGQNTSANGSNVTLNQTGFTIKYNVTKRSNPAITFYSTLTANTAGVVTGTVYGNVGATNNPVTNSSDLPVATLWELFSNTTGTGLTGVNAASYMPILANFFNTATVTIGATNTAHFSSHISFHCTIDARIGVVA